MALLSDEHLYVANLGDSRVYLLRNGSLRQLTEDHSLVAELVRYGVISHEQAKTHRNLNVIMRTMGGTIPRSARYCA